jgi:hypothetical protein
LSRICSRIVDLHRVESSATGIGDGTSNRIEKMIRGIYAKTNLKPGCRQRWLL